MYCEICGRRILGRPALVKVRGAMLQVCSECAKGKIAIRPQKPVLSVSKPQPARRLPQVVVARRPPKPREEPELSLRPKQDYGRAIHKAREGRGMTVEQFSRSVGIRGSLVRKIEAEKIVPSISDLKKIERILGVRLVEQYSEEEITGVAGREPTLTLGEATELRRSEENDES